MEDREDLEQEILLQLWRSWDSFRHDASISTWIYRIAMNTAISFVRKDSRFRRSEDRIPETATDDGRKVSEDREELYTMLRKLSEPDRMLALLYLQDLSYQEMADVTGWTVNNLGVRMNRLKNRLKDLYKDGRA